jgi:hypothetical protein
LPFEPLFALALALAALLLALSTIAPLSMRAWSAGGGAWLLTRSCSA